MYLGTSWDVVDDADGFAVGVTREGGGDDVELHLPCRLVPGPHPVDRLTDRTLKATDRQVKGRDRQFRERGRQMRERRERWVGKERWFRERQVSREILVRERETGKRGER